MVSCRWCFFLSCSLSPLVWWASSEWIKCLLKVKTGKKTPTRAHNTHSFINEFTNTFVFAWKSISISRRWLLVARQIGKMYTLNEYLFGNRISEVINQISSAFTYSCIMCTYPPFSDQLDCTRLSFIRYWQCQILRITKSAKSLAADLYISVCLCISAIAFVS